MCSSLSARHSAPEEWDFRAARSSAEPHFSSESPSPRAGRKTNWSFSLRRTPGWVTTRPCEETFRSVIVFCLYREGPRSPLNATTPPRPPAWPYSCRAVNNSDSLAPSRRGTPVMHFNQTGLRVLTVTHPPPPSPPPPRDMQPEDRVWPSDSITYLAAHYFIPLTL